jgi:hypothetical protein
LRCVFCCRLCCSLCVSRYRRDVVRCVRNVLCSEFLIVRIDVRHDSDRARHVRPARRPAGRRRGSSSTGHCPPTPARSRVCARFGRVSYPVSSVRRGEREPRGPPRRRRVARRARAVQRPPSSARPAAGLLLRRITNTKNERRIVRPRYAGGGARLTGARPVKPAVGWYMPFGFRSGQNRATCGS